MGHDMRLRKLFFQAAIEYRICMYSGKWSCLTLVILIFFLTLRIILSHLNQRYILRAFSTDYLASKLSSILLKIRIFLIIHIIYTYVHAYISYKYLFTIVLVYLEQFKIFNESIDSQSLIQVFPYM